jgi:hypothetical protein
MPNLSEYFATPALWTPDMSSEEWESEVAMMLNRSIACRDFVQNKISPDDFAEALFENGFNPDTCFDLWEEGETLK